MTCRGPEYRCGDAKAGRWFDCLDSGVDHGQRVVGDFCRLVEAEFPMRHFDQRRLDRPIACAANGDGYCERAGREGGALPGQDGVTVTRGEENQDQHVTMSQIERVRDTGEESRGAAPENREPWRAFD